MGLKYRETKTGVKLTCPLCPREFSANFMLQAHLRAHTREKPFICDQCDFETVNQKCLDIHVAKVHTLKSNSSQEETKFRCPLCPHECRDQALLRSHLKTHTKEKPYFCEHCEFESGSPLSLELHINKVHPGGNSAARLEELKKFKCEECGFKSFRKEQLRVHQARHREERPFPCSFPDCKFRGKQKGDLKQHLRSHSTVRNYPCPVPGCNYSAKSKATLNDHTACHNTERPFACEFAGCTMRFPSKGRLAQHRRIHDLRLQLKCPYPNCIFRTPHNGLMIQHKLKHKDDKPYHCKEPSCDYRAGSDSGIRNHIRTKHSESPPRYTCPRPNCGRAFFTKYNLEAHRRKHMTEKTFACSKCSFRAKLLSSLRKHDKFEHTGRRVFRCPEESCPFTTHHPSTFRSHQLQHERNPHFRYYLCHVAECKFATSNSEKLQRHVQSHSDPQRSLPCPFCPRSFAFPAPLQAHLAVHTKEKHFNCSQCSFACSTEQGVRRHLRLVHGVDSNSPKCQFLKAESSQNIITYSKMLCKFPVVTLERIAVA